MGKSKQMTKTKQNDTESGQTATASATPGGKGPSKREATSPLYSEIVLHKKNRPGSPGSAEENDSLETCEIATTESGSGISDGDGVHMLSQPMNPIDIVHIATELRSIMLPELKALLNEMMPHVKDIVFTAVREARSDLNKEIEGLKVENEDIKKELQDVKDKNQELKKTSEILHKRLAEVEADTDALEQYGRRNILRVSGVPETPQEDTDDLIMNIARSVNVTISPSDIDRSHRIGKMPSERGSAGNRRHRDILVKFVSYNARQQLYTKRKDLHKTEDMKNIFINEDLTKQRSKLLFEARNLVRVGKLKAAYASDGKILVRDSGDSRHLIKHYNDLSQFGDPRETRREQARRANLPPPRLFPTAGTSSEPVGNPDSDRHL